MKHKVWKKYPYDNNYEISTTGEVRRIYKDHTRNLTPTTFRDGYKYVVLTKNSKGKAIAVHRLVALTFIKKSGRTTQVNHIDGNKGNNSIKNLEWVTPSQNIMHAYKNNLIIPPHEKPVQCIENGKMYRSVRAASRATNICFTSISMCCRNKLKTAGKLHWRFSK